MRNIDLPSAAPSGGAARSGKAGPVVATGLLVSALSATFAIVACTPYDPALPAQPFSCGSADPKCPDGYTCKVDGSSGRALCESGSGGSPAVDAAAGPDGASSFVCEDPNDMSTGPNETPQSPTMLALARNPFTVTNLSICPATDKDNFLIHLGATTNLEVKMTYDADGAPLTLGLLNSQDASIVQCPGPQCTVSGQSIDAKVPSAASGDYIIQILGPGASGTDGGENNYQLVITTS